MTNHVLSKKLLDLIWGVTLAMTFAFTALLILSLAVSFAANAHLIKIPDRICNPDSARSGVTQICT
jgi:uncharacterized BrkB/YihY/UPF0761 family membrane protein